MTAPTSYPEALAAAAAARAGAGTVSPNHVVAATAEGVITVRERAAAAAKRALRSLWVTVNPYDGKQVDAFAAKGVKILAAAQTATGRAAAAAVVTQLKAMDIKVDALPDIPVDVRAPAATVTAGKVTLEHHDHTVEYANGDTHTVTAEEMTTEAVLKRPAAGFRWIQSEDGLDAAEQSGLRIDQIVDDNLMLAQRLAETQVLAKAVDLDAKKSTVRVIGYRRVIHPELSRTGTCGLCIAAADRIYRVGDLRPVHANCKCTIAPVTADHDPADDLNKADLQALYDTAGGTSAAHLKRTRYQVDDHGELGAVLVPEKPYKPRDEKKRAAATNNARAAGPKESKDQIAARHLPLLEKSLADLRARGLSEDSPQVTYHKQQIDKYRATLAEGR